MPHNPISIFHFHSFHHLNSSKAHPGHLKAHQLFSDHLSIELSRFTFPPCGFQILHFDLIIFIGAAI
jgi:hypothetical protein